VLTADSSKDVHVDELEILKQIRNIGQDHPGYNHVNQLLDNFRIQGPHGEHLCLVFEVLGMDMRNLRDRFEGNKLPMALLKQVARQTLLALDYLHTRCRIIHCGTFRGRNY
jgi:serine/threonine-protein kinase SRPK3